MLIKVNLIMLHSAGFSVDVTGYCKVMVVTDIQSILLCFEWLLG